MAGIKRRPGALPTVQETLLKKRKAAIEARASHLRQQAKDRQKVRKQRKRGSSFVRVERLVKLGKLKDRDTSRISRLLRRAGPQPLAPMSVAAVVVAAAASAASADASVAATAATPDASGAAAARSVEERPILIVRCRGRAAGMDTRVARALRLFRLSRLNSAVFARPTPACLSVLRLVEPFVAWGCPDMRSVRELVYKRGHALVKGRPAPITDNAMVEDSLGSRGLLCIEDLVHELATCGPAFVQAASFLCPLRLRAPLTGWQKAEAKFREPSRFSGGVSGGGVLHWPLACSRDEYMNSLLREMI